MGTRGGGGSSERVRLKVLYDFEYETRGKRVRIVKDERLLLLKKTNDDWWQVARPADLLGSSSFYVPEHCTFYVPTGYVTESQEEQLPESTRFYVDKDRMFKFSDTPGQAAADAAQCNSNVGNQLQHSNNANNNVEQSTAMAVTKTGGKESEPRKAHDSFRNVIRKLSGNLTSHNDPAKAVKPVKPSKLSRNPRKNSADSTEDGIKTPSGKSILGIVPVKHKDTWEGSTFGMCFGRDVKNTDAQLLNPFQEELTNRVTRKKTVLDNKVEISNKQVDQVQEETEDSNFENIHSKWEKVSAQVLKKSDNFQIKATSKLQADTKKRSISPNLQSNDAITNSNVEAKLKQDKLYSIVEKNSKKQLQIVDEQSNSSNKSDTVVLQKTHDPIGQQDLSPKSDIDKLINDKRKMWAIETLMAELMQSSSNSKTITSSGNSEKDVSGPNQLAQELHEMNKSRRFENAEIQVNLLDNNDGNTKENEQPNSNANFKMELRKKKVFDFSPSSNLTKVPKSPTARSPKLLDEYNEANILNDNEKSKEIKDAMLLNYNDYNESPSYSNISLQIKREKVPCSLKMPTKDFREELQLTPSLEKLANEIKFLPASANNSMELESEKNSLDMDCPTTTTLSQDSLRLYKRRSKSDGALNKRDPRRRDSCSAESGRRRRCRNPSSASYLDIGSFDACSVQSPPPPPVQQQQRPLVERKYARSSSFLVSTVNSSSTGEHHHYHCYRPERAPRHYTASTGCGKLNRKSRSLGDLDCSGGAADEEESMHERQEESRRRYKPVPKLRSKESLRIIRQPAQPDTPVTQQTTTKNSEHVTRPVPAKRRIQPRDTPPLQQQQQQSVCSDNNSSYYDDESSDVIDIERSTAVGFKTLLRTSDSGSEEYLQYKSFPSTAASKQSLQQQQQKSHQSTPKLAASPRSDGNISSSSSRLSRSLSDEMILSSGTSCSSSAASPSSRARQLFLLDGSSSLENLVELPPGWSQSYDHNAKRVCFINERGDKWFSSNDEEGKIYFFEENSNESSWALPSTVVHESRVRTMSNSDWPQLFHGNMCILKEGLINKTKITTENGKKLRKTWSTSYAVLTELFLLFFKDAKSFAAMKMDQSTAAAAKPEISVDLNGAFIEPADKLSNRKNVYLISTLLGLQVLIQSDNALVISEWYQGIHDAIQRLPFSQEYGKSSSSRE